MAELTENLIRLKFAAGVGNLILWRLLTRFGDSDRLLGATATAIAAVEGMSAAKAEAILESSRHDPRPEMDRALAAGVNIIPYDDPEYPKPLLSSFDPPAVLYVLGQLRPEDQVAVGIVGTRHASPYGRDQALALSGALARAGYTVVSGLARGIDTYAHIGALDAKGRTVGVLGCGFDHMYPEENRDLALEMSASGAVISEFSMATSPSKATFPARNRIIAGMSLGLLVVEAPLRSGSLITARLANEIGRLVFAVPGRVGDAGSEGCNKLIKDGAVIVNGIDDILEELNPALPPPPLPERKKGREKKAATKSLFAEAVSNASEAEPGTRLADPPAPTCEGKRPWTLANEAAAAPGRKTAADQSRSAVPSEAPRIPNPRLTPEQARILAEVAGEWLSADDIGEASGVPAHQAAAALAKLKLMRLVEQGPAQTYRRAGTGN